MNIVYGGSFNPPTLAHLKIVNKLLEEYNNANIIVLPVGNSYNKPELIDFKHRFNMLEIMFKNENRVLISKLEEVKAFDGTLKSLEELSKIYQNLVLVIGSDNINEFDKWINYQKLLKKYPLIIMQRNNDNVKELMMDYERYAVKYEVVEFNEEISSTLIRKNIFENKNLLDEKIYQYIKDNGLYGVK